MISLPVTEQAKQQKWNTILPIAKNNGSPLHFIHNTKNKLINKIQHIYHTSTPKEKMDHIHLLLSTYAQNNLFSHTNLNIAFRATNTIY